MKENYWPKKADEEGVAKKAYEEMKKVYEHHTVIKRLEEEFDILKLPATIPKLIPLISYIFNYNKDFDNKNEDFEKFIMSNKEMYAEMNDFGSITQDSLKVVNDGNYTVFMICIYCLKAYIQSKMETTSNKTKITSNQKFQKLCSITLDCISNIYNAFTSITFLNKDIRSIQNLLNKNEILTKAYEAFSEQDPRVQFAIFIIVLYQLYLKKKTLETTHNKTCSDLYGLYEYILSSLKNIKNKFNKNGTFDYHTSDSNGRQTSSRGSNGRQTSKRDSNDRRTSSRGSNGSRSSNRGKKSRRSSNRGKKNRKTNSNNVYIAV